MELVLSKFMWIHYHYSAQVNDEEMGRVRNTVLNERVIIILNFEELKYAMLCNMEYKNRFACFEKIDFIRQFGLFYGRDIFWISKLTSMYHFDLLLQYLM